MASGVRRYAAATARARPVSSRASSGNRRRLEAACPLEDGDVVDRVLDAELRLPADQLAQRGGVRLALAQLLEPVVVGLVVGDEADRRRGSGPFDDPARELEDGD